MPNKDDLLERFTFKGQVGTLFERVCYTIDLRNGEDAFSTVRHPMQVETHEQTVQRRQTVLLGKLVEALHDAKVIDEETIDDILFALTR